MTYAELTSLINTNLTRVGNNRVSASEIKQVCLALLDFAAAIDNTDAIPTWTAVLTFQTDGTGAGKYCTHPDANGTKRIFETKIANNTGNEPPTDPNITEDAFWEEISASAGSAIHEWTPGVYGVGLVIVYHSHTSDGRGLYILLEPVRPFNSTDIEAEILAGKWDRLNIENLQKTLARGNSAGDQRIRDLADPLDPQDADTKAAREAAVTALDNSLRANVPVAGDNLEKLYNLIFGIGAFAGNHDASAGALPLTGTGPAGAINKGDYWIVTIGGTIAGIAGADTLQPNDVIYAKQAGANLAAHFFGVNTNVDLATPTELGLVKLVQELVGAGLADTVLSSAAVKILLDLKKNVASSAATNVTGNIAGGAVTIDCAGRSDTDVYLKTDVNLNINWQSLNEGAVLFISVERTTSAQISINFNGGNNLDCFMIGSGQQIGVGSPLLLDGVSGVGLTRRYHDITVESIRDITANKVVYRVRSDDSGSIVV